METICCENRPRKMKKAVFGLLVIAAGAIWLGINLGYIDPGIKHIVFSWPMLLLSIGLINLADKDSRFTGLVLTLIGGFFLAARLINTPYDFIGIYWPVLVIGVGILIFFSALGKRVFGGRLHHHHVTNVTNSGDLDEVNIFGGSKKKIGNKNFTGGKIVNIFGGTELDLTQADMADGNCVLDVACIFGGVTVIVPPEWSVQVSVVSILGGFGDKRTVIQSRQDPNKLIIIKGVAIFGGGEIKSY